MDIRKNKQKLIKTLYDAGTWIKCPELSAVLGVPERSVRYLIRQVNNDKRIIVSSNKGYKLDESYNILYGYNDNEETPETAADRKTYIYEKLVVANQIKDIDELLDFFCISTSTFNSEMQIWKKELGEYEIYLKTKNGTLFSIGKERSRQKFAMSIIKDELTRAAFSLENIQSFFHNVNLFDIKNIVQRVFARKQYYLDDYSLLTYILHLALRIELSDNMAESNNAEIIDRSFNYNDMDINPAVQEIVEEISSSLTELYPNTHFTRTDVYEASLLMMTRLLPKNNPARMMYGDVRQIVGDEITELYETILAEVNDIYAVDLNSTRFMYRFSLHIKNLIYRIENGITLKEGQFVNIKDSYPFLFTIAVHISYLISNYIGKPLPENEICYIALHVGAILEDKNVKSSRLVCGILAQDYYEIAKNIAEKVEKTFEDDVTIATIATNYDQLANSYYQYDLVISTYDIAMMPVQSVTIGLFPDESDMKRVKDKIEQIKNRIREKKMIRNIQTFLHDDICYFKQDFSSPSEVFDFVCDRLSEKDMIYDTLKEDLLKHEEIAPSSYTNFAIAHTLTNNDKMTFVSLCTNSKPISWGDNEVNIIFIISLNKKDRGKFKTIFDSLTSIMFRENVTSRILQVNSYDEFIDIIRENYQ